MLLRPLALLALTAPVFADDPPEQLVEELAELREQITGEAGVVSDRADFAEALRRVAGNEGRAAVADNHAQAGWNDHSWPGPGPRHPDRPNAYGRRPGPTPALPSIPPRHAGWGPGPQYQDRPQLSGPRPPRPTKVLLREAAFELDRLAHELEMAELVEEADSLRDTAKKLRKSARKQGGSAEAARRGGRRPKAGPRSNPQPSAGDKPRRGRPSEDSPSFSPHENWGERAERRRKQRAPDRDAEPLQNALEGRRLDLIGPPPGVHGGPTEPPKPEDE